MAHLGWIYITLHSLSRCFCLTMSKTFSPHTDGGERTYYASWKWTFKVTKKKKKKKSNVVTKFWSLKTASLHFAPCWEGWWVIKLFSGRPCEQLKSLRVQVEVLWPEIRSVSYIKSHIHDITSCPAPAPLASVTQCNMLFIIFRLFIVFVKNEVCSWSLLSIFSDKSAPFSMYYYKISSF